MKTAHRWQFRFPCQCLPPRVGSIWTWQKFLRSSLLDRAGQTVEYAFTPTATHAWWFWNVFLGLAATSNVKWSICSFHQCSWNISYGLPRRDPGLNVLMKHYWPDCKTLIFPTPVLFLARIHRSVLVPGAQVHANHCAWVPWIKSHGWRPSWSTGELFW